MDKLSSSSPDPEEIPVIILCGGKGLRLRPMTEETPKPLLEIGQKPIVQHVMDNFAEHGFTNFTLCVGYLSEAFFSHFDADAENSTRGTSAGTTSAMLESRGQSVSVLDTGLETGLADRIDQALKRVDASRAIVTYGDTLADVDISSLYAYHEGHQRSATITGVRTRCPYGVLRGEDGTVSELDEKPLLPQRINGGFFVYDRTAFDYFDSDQGLVSIVNEIASDGELEMFEHDGYFDGVDTHKDLSRVRAIAEEETNLPWIDYTA